MRGAKPAQVNFHACTATPGDFRSSVSRPSRQECLRHVYMTVSVAEFETSPLGLVTWTASAGEVDAVVTATNNCEELTNMTWLPEYGVLPTVTWRPAPDWKFVPLTVSTCVALEWINGLGISDVIAGSGGAFTCRLTLFETPPLALATCTG